MCTLADCRRISALADLQQSGLDLKHQSKRPKETLPSTRLRILILGIDEGDYVSTSFVTQMLWRWRAKIL